MGGHMSRSCAARSGCIATVEILDECYSGDGKEQFAAALEVARGHACRRLRIDHGQCEAMSYGVGAAVRFAGTQGATWKHFALWIEASESSNDSISSSPSRGEEHEGAEDGSWRLAEAYTDFTMPGSITTQTIGGNVVMNMAQLEVCDLSEALDDPQVAAQLEIAGLRILV